MGLDRGHVGWHVRETRTIESEREGDAWRDGMSEPQTPAPTQQSADAGVTDGHEPSSSCPLHGPSEVWGGIADCAFEVGVRAAAQGRTAHGGPRGRGVLSYITPGQPIS